MKYGPLIVNALKELGGSGTGSAIAKKVLGDESKYASLRESLTELVDNGTIEKVIAGKGKMPVWNLTSYKRQIDCPPNLKSSSKGQLSIQKSNSSGDIADKSVGQLTDSKLKNWVGLFFRDGKLHTMDELTEEAGGERYRTRIKTALKKLVKEKELIEVKGINMKDKKIKAWVKS